MMLLDYFWGSVRRLAPLTADREVELHQDRHHHLIRQYKEDDSIRILGVSLILQLSPGSASPRIQLKFK